VQEIYGERISNRDREIMFIMPDGIRTNEEWMIWLLGKEFHEKAGADMLVQRTHLSMEQVEEAARNLERIKAVRTERQGGVLTRVFMLPYGKTLLRELEVRLERYTGYDP
jgi:hypothetical protein